MEVPVEMLIVLVVLGAPVAVAALFVTAVLKPEIRERLKTAAHLATRSMAGRMILLTCTLVALLIPLEMVDELRRERGYRLQEVQAELNQQWGGPQNVVGPILFVPVIDHSEERVEKVGDDGQLNVWMRPVAVQRNFLVLPDTLVVDGAVQPQALHRGLYDVLVYDADVTLAATFSQPDFPARAGHEIEVLWSEAQLLVELSDLSAVNEVTALSWQDRELRPEAGAVPTMVGHAGISGAVDGFEGDTAQVTVGLKLRGMDSLLTGPVAETTRIALDGTWDAPSFTGFTLPTDRSVSGDAFEAAWTVPGVARPVPQLVEITDRTPLDQLRAHTVGVRLVEPASAYISVERAMTYGMLVITLALLTFLVLEHGLGLALHPVQWLVNGLALVVFYLVLLASSEHQGFDLAYGLASTLTITMVTAYSLLATRSIRIAAAVFPALSLLYGCMYAMLRSEDHALIMGTGLVVIALACTMWVTRHLGRATLAEPTLEPAPA